MENVEALEAIITKGIVCEVDGKKYSAHAMNEIRPYKPSGPEKIDISTLGGFVSYCKKNIDCREVQKLLIVVDSINQVNLISVLNDDNERECLISATLTETEKMRFGDFMDHETFIIKLRSLFVDGGDRQKLIEYVSRLSINNGIETHDDGVTQSAVVKSGMSGALKSSEIAPAIVRLAPYRTFREVDQPRSEFLFRMKAIEGKIPACALFEADGGAWKIDAIENIANYLKSELPEMVVIA